MPCGPTEGRTDMMMPIVAFRNFPTRCKIYNNGNITFKPFSGVQISLRRLPSNSEPLDVIMWKYTTPNFILTGDEIWKVQAQTHFRNVFLKQDLRNSYLPHKCM